MFKGGSAWRPPQMNPYSQGMPEELVEGSNTYQPMPVEEGPKKGILTDRLFIYFIYLFIKPHWGL